VSCWKPFRNRDVNVPYIHAGNEGEWPDIPPGYLTGKLLEHCMAGIIPGKDGPGETSRSVGMPHYLPFPDKYFDAA